MGLQFEASGGAKLHVAAAQIKAVGNKGLGQKMRRGLTAATEPLKREIRAEATRVMPARGGYRAVMPPSLKFRLATRTSAFTAAVALTTYADGKSQRRDVRKLDAGILRHPVYGRSRRIRRGRRAGTVLANPWATTRIRSGFWTRPVDKAAAQVERDMTKVLDETIDELKG